jgi:hypothetical protein
VCVCVRVCVCVCVFALCVHLMLPKQHVSPLQLPCVIYS